MYEYLVGGFNNLQNFRLMKVVNMKITHSIKVQIILEHIPYFSELNYKPREIITIAYYLHRIQLFQYNVVSQYHHTSGCYYLILNALARVRSRPDHAGFVVKKRNDPLKSVPQSSLYGLTPVSIIPTLPHTNVHSSVANHFILAIDRVVKQNTSTPLPLSVTWVWHKQYKHLRNSVLFMNFLKPLL
jgi:hypothetical protein